MLKFTFLSFLFLQDRKCTYTSEIQSAISLYVYLIISRAVISLCQHDENKAFNNSLMH